MRRRETLIFLLLAAWFIYFAKPGLRAWFSADDLMNLSGVQAKSVPAIVLSLDRPVPNLAYKAMYTAFGFHPRPYRYVAFALLLANLALALALMRRLSGSLTVTLLGGLLFAYHAQLADLYFSTGTIYDLLCFLFYFSAVLIYVSIRAAGRAPTWLETAALAALAMLAMGSKEMAATLPVMLAVSELVYGNRRSWRVPIAAAAVCGAMTAAVLWGTAMTANASYKPEFTFAMYQARWHSYLTPLLYRGAWSINAMWATLGVIVTLAIALRRREAWWALALIFIASLPVLFVAQRSLYAFYIPYFGFTLLGGSLLARLTRLAWPRGPAGPVLAAVSLGLWLYPNHQFMRKYGEQGFHDWDALVAKPGNALRHAWPKLPPGATVYFVDDPFPGGGEADWNLLYIVQLASGDPTAGVWRQRYDPQRVPEPEWGRFAAVFRLGKTGLTRVR